MDEFSFHDLRIDVQREVGILTGNAFVAGTFQGEPWEHHLHFCDLYLKSATGWQVFLSHALETQPPPTAIDSDGIESDR